MSSKVRLGLGIALVVLGCSHSNAPETPDAPPPDTMTPPPPPDGPEDAAGAGFWEPCVYTDDCATDTCYTPVGETSGHCTNYCTSFCPDGFECKTGARCT